jgi:hypothetical protein
MRKRIVVGLLGVGMSVALLAGAATPAGAEDPLFLNWSQLVPGLTSGYDANSANDCTSGKINCVTAAVREMTRRFDALAENCDHDALFALAYLRTTEEYKRSAETPGFYSDVNFINHEDAVFARYYLSAYDAWSRGDIASVPKAWQVALGAADARSVNGTTNILLGISAHINRDLPFVLWQIGLVKPDGTSRKPDHDKVNEFLNKVDLFGEAHDRFDASIDPNQAPGGIQSIIAMRETAWRNAERLRAAENDPVAFAAVKQSIEDAAYTAALAIKASGAYVSTLGQSSATRDSYCRAQQSA